MASPTLTTVMKMLESLPEPTQDQVLEHLREYLEDLQDDVQWDLTFQRTQPQLIAAAQRARQAIAEGQAHPLAEGQL